MTFDRRAFLHAGAAAAASASVIAGAPSFVAAQAPLVTVRVAAALEDDATPILYGVQAGVFKKYGLDVQLQGIASGSAAAAAVAGGAIEIGKSSLTSLIAAHVRGLPFALVAPSGLYTSKDLMTLATQAWIDQHGGDSTGVKFLELPSSSVTAALDQGKVDGATMLYPALAEALNIAKNTDVVRRFAAAVRESTIYANAHHAETLPLVAAWSKIPADTLAHMTRSTSAVTFSLAEIQPVIAASAKYKIIDKEFPAQDLIANLGRPAA